jgi:hypothetical protein
MEFQADRVEVQQQAQLLASRAAAGREAATGSSKQQQQQQQQPKHGTLQAIWGRAASRAAAVLHKLSPAKGNRTNLEPSTHQLQQQPEQQSSHGPQEPAEQPPVEGMQQPDAAGQQQGPGVQQLQGVEQPKGPWDPEGFAWRQLDPKFAAKVFNSTGDERRVLQARMMAAEPAGGHVSLDHVHQTAKRMQGGFIGMVIAMSASGTVLGFWNVYSTSLQDIESQLRALDQRQRSQHGQVSGHRQDTVAPAVGGVLAALSTVLTLMPWGELLRV